MPFTPGSTVPVIPGGPTNPVGIVIGIIDFILGLFGIGSVDTSVLTTAINNTYANLVMTTAFLYNAIGYLTQFVRRFISILFDGLKHILSDILHGQLRKVLQDIQSLFHALHDLFAPILAFLQRVHDWFYKYILPWILRVQDLLSRLRVILTLFRILGAKWAAKLDADIGRIQGYITAGLQGIVGTLNQVVTWLNIIVDPFGIIRKDFFTGTLFSSLGALKNAVNFGNGRDLTATEIQHEADDRALVFSPTGILTRNADGTVTFSDAASRMNAGAESAVDYYGRVTTLH